MKFVLSRRCTLVIMCILAAAGCASTARESQEGNLSTVVSVRGKQLLLNGRPATLLGFRVGSAALRDDWTEELISQLPLWRQHGVNGFTIWLQGTSGGYARVVTTDGATIDPMAQPIRVRTGYGLKEVQAQIGETSGVAVISRARRIVEAANRQGMVVVVGFFYRSSVDKADTRQSTVNAARALALPFRDYPNVILNVWNEIDIRRPLETVESIVAYARAIRQVAPQRLLCVGSSDRNMNTVLSAVAEADLYCQDAGRTYQATIDAFEELAAAGKPVINVESYGGNGGGYVDGPISAMQPPPGYTIDFQAQEGWRRVYGAWQEDDYRDGTGRVLMGRKAYLDLIRHVAADRTGQRHLFVHAAAWFQGASRTQTAAQIGDWREPGKWNNVFHPGYGLGRGTMQEPGIRWVLEEFAQLRKQAH